MELLDSHFSAHRTCGRGGSKKEGKKSPLITITTGCRSFHNMWASLADDVLSCPLVSLWSANRKPRGIWIHITLFRAPTGVFLLQILVSKHCQHQIKLHSTYLRAGSLPKKATNTRNEIARTPIATFFTTPMIAFSWARTLYFLPFRSKILIENTLGRFSAFTKSL